MSGHLVPLECAVVDEEKARTEGRDARAIDPTSVDAVAFGAVARVVLEMALGHLRHV